MRRIRRAEENTPLGWSTYETWLSMRKRCLSPNNRAYRLYGERGITICSRWDSFNNFLDDMGVKPTFKHTIDRIDANGNYEPANCRWLTKRLQGRNRRNTQQWRRHDSL